MMDCYDKGAAGNATLIIPLVASEFYPWLEKQNSATKEWLRVSGFKAERGKVCLLPDKSGGIKRVLLGLADHDDFWVYGALPGHLPEGLYKIKANLSKPRFNRAAIAWGLGSYKYLAFKEDSAPYRAKLALAQNCDESYIRNCVESLCWARDLINTPADTLGPATLAKMTTSLAVEFGATVDQIVGDDLLKNNLNAIHAVGRGGAVAPRLIDLNWGKSKNPAVTLIGKGVCFDSGGLNLKTGLGMLLMKKDMSGAAYALALARMIMAADLPIKLRVLIPAVENMLTANSYRPGDVIKTYKGLSVEVTNTDAEGRLILADALAVACEEKPDLLLDFASLTRAARIALGADITALFTDGEPLARAILDNANVEQDSIWRLPLYADYCRQLEGNISDLVNSSNSGEAGAIVAALFLQKFVPKEQQWVHFDVVSHNDKPRPGHPKGAEVTGLRAVFNFLQQRYKAAE